MLSFNNPLLLSRVNRCNPEFTAHSAPTVYLCVMTSDNEPNPESLGDSRPTNPPLLSVMSSSYAKTDGWLDWEGLVLSLRSVCVCVCLWHMEGSCRDKRCLTGLSEPVDSWLCEG